MVINKTLKNIVLGNTWDFESILEHKLDPTLDQIKNLIVIDTIDNLKVKNNDIAAAGFINTCLTYVTLKNVVFGGLIVGGILLYYHSGGGGGDLTTDVEFLKKEMSTLIKTFHKLESTSMKAVHDCTLESKTVLKAVNCQLNGMKTVKLMLDDVISNQGVLLTLITSTTAVTNINTNNIPSNNASNFNIGSTEL